MANKIETSSKNIKPRINLNHNIYLSKVLEVSFFAIIAVLINVYFWNFYKSHIVQLLEQRKSFVKFIRIMSFCFDQ